MILIENKHRGWNFHWISDKHGEAIEIVNKSEKIRIALAVDERSDKSKEFAWLVNYKGRRAWGYAEKKNLTKVIMSKFPDLIPSESEIEKLIAEGLEILKLKILKKK